MTNEHDRESDTVPTMVYQIKIKGHLGDQWTDWFEGVTITLETNGNTLLNCAVIDQAALHGLLKKVRDLGMPLISVNQIDPEANRSDHRSDHSPDTDHQRSKKETTT
jgi:hypothetical protein